MKRNIIDNDGLMRLKREVEKFVAFPLVTPHDFNRLSDIIRQRGCGYISPTTLKRVWGYINDVGSHYSPGSYTLRTLCSLLGFESIKTFLENPRPLQSAEFLGHFMECRLLPPGARLQLQWPPNRRCVLRHRGDALFDVIVAENGRLRQGDLVECVSVTMNAPAYFTRVYRDGQQPMSYIAGTTNGVSFKLLSESTGIADPEKSHL